LVDIDPEYQYNKTMFNAIEKILTGLATMVAGLFVGGAYLLYYLWMIFCLGLFIFLITG